MRLTVLGCGPASPQPDTPASGLLIESGATALLLDCGQGVAARLVRRIDPGKLTAIVIGHMHADHFIDLSALRYRFVWAGRSAVRVPLLLPPGGIDRFAELAGVISERASFFEDAFDVREYDPATPERFGDLGMTFVAGRHYVPAWGVSLTEPDGARIVYAGDTGPNPGLLTAARGADLLVLEATLASSAEDDEDARGHLTLDEAIEHGQGADVKRLLVTHYPSARRSVMAAQLEDLEGWAALARPDVALTVAGRSTGASDGSEAMGADGRGGGTNAGRGSIRAAR